MTPLFLLATMAVAFAPFWVPSIWGTRTVRAIRKVFNRAFTFADEVGEHVVQRIFKEKNDE